MSRRLSFVAAAALFAIPLAARAAEYQIDPAHSAAAFKVRHMMISDVRGEFTTLAGKISYDAKNPAATVIEATIDAKSISTRNVDRDTHLKGPDFFDVAKYPTITFRSRKAAAAGTGRLKVTGDLTMHGVTKEVVLDVAGPSAEAKDPWGNVKVGATATTKLNRKDFGLTWNKALETGGMLVGEDVEITIDIEGAAVKATTAATK